eukprot:5781549-Prymnesium_polylepis.1
MCSATLSASRAAPSRLPTSRSCARPIRATARSRRAPTGPTAPRCRTIRSRAGMCSATLSASRAAP